MTGTRSRAATAATRSSAAVAPSAMRRRANRAAPTAPSRASAAASSWRAATDGAHGDSSGVSSSFQLLPVKITRWSGASCAAASTVAARVAVRSLVRARSTTSQPPPPTARSCASRTLAGVRCGARR